MTTEGRSGTRRQTGNMKTELATEDRTGHRRYNWQQKTELTSKRQNWQWRAEPATETATERQNWRGYLLKTVAGCLFRTVVGYPLSI